MPNLLDVPSVALRNIFDNVLPEEFTVKVTETKEGQKKLLVYQHKLPPPQYGAANKPIYANIDFLSVCARFREEAIPFLLAKRRLCFARPVHMADFLEFTTVRQTPCPRAMILHLMPPNFDHVTPDADYAEWKALKWYELKKQWCNSFTMCPARLSSVVFYLDQLFFWEGEAEMASLMKDLSATIDSVSQGACTVSVTIARDWMSDRRIEDISVEKFVERPVAVLGQPLQAPWEW